MKKRLMDYKEKTDRLLKAEAPDTDWDKALSEHLIQIGFFQHERLVHLIVTVTFGLFLIIITALLLTVHDRDTFVGILALFAIIAVTLVFYIFHYYALENGVQKLYDQYDELLRKRS